MDWPSLLRRAGITLLHIDVVKQGVKWSVLVLLSHSSISGTGCSPLPCKTNMRCSRCLEISRQGPHERFLLCVVMGRKLRDTAQWSKDVWWCCVCREEGYLHASIDYRRGRAHLPQPSPGLGLQERWLRSCPGDVFLASCIYRILFEKLLFCSKPETSDAAVSLGCTCGQLWVKGPTTVWT